MKRPSEREMHRTCDVCSGSGRSEGHALNSCPHCLGHGVSHIRCSQCWKWKNVAHYIGKKGGLVKRCNPCTEKYKDWSKKTLEERERATSPRRGINEEGPLRVGYALRSNNKKTGPILVTMTSAGTCPSSCPLKNRGCYAEQHMTAIHWRRVSKGNYGLTWTEFVRLIDELPDGTLWRHNEAGDLPGTDNEVDYSKLSALVLANSNKRGFTYTHKPLTPLNIIAFKKSTKHGFTINISTDTLEAADTAANWGLPVVTVLPHDAPVKGNTTPQGRTVVVCPAEVHDHVTCSTCKLCAVGNRKCIVGFRAHGDRKKQITERHRQLPLL